jgi:hypothetical protein
MPIHDWPRVPAGIFYAVPEYWRDFLTSRPSE